MPKNHPKPPKPMPLPKAKLRAPHPAPKHRKPVFSKGDVKKIRAAASNPRSQFLEMVKRTSDIGVSAPLPDGCRLRPETVAVQMSIAIETGSYYGGTTSAQPATICVVPDPTIMFLNPTIANNSGQLIMRTMDGTPTTINPTITTGSPAATQILSPVASSTLKSMATAYRVTACKASIRSTAASNMQAAEITTALLPIVNVVGNTTVVTNQTLKTPSAYANSFVNTDVTTMTNSLNTTSKKFTTYDVMENVIEINLMPSDDRAFQWRSVAGSAATDYTQAYTGDTVGSWVVEGTSSGLGITSNAIGEPLDVRGWPMLLINICRGQPSQSVISVQVDLRYEIIRNYSTDVGLFTNSSAPGGPRDVSQILADIQRMPIYRVVRSLAVDGQFRKVTNSLLATVAGITL